MPKPSVATIPCTGTLFEAMPAALPAVTISDVQPTAEELERVRALRATADKRSKHSTDVAFKAFLRKNADENASASTGELKEKCILNFMVLQLRAESATKTVRSSQQVVVKQSKSAEKHWFNEFQMDREMGPTIGKHWRDSKLLTVRPDPVTGSTHPDHVVYGVPKLWESMTEEDIKQMVLESSRDAVQGDDQAIQELSDLTKSKTMEDDPEKTKVAMSPAEIQQAFINDIKGNPACYLRKYQDAKTNCVVLQALVEPDKAKSRFSHMLHEDTTALIVRLTQVLTLLETMVSKNVKDTAVKKLSTDITAIDSSITEVMQMGKNFGYEWDGTKGKKRKKAAKS